MNKFLIDSAELEQFLNIGKYLGYSDDHLQNTLDTFHEFVRNGTIKTDVPTKDKKAFPVKPTQLDRKIDNEAWTTRISLPGINKADLLNVRQVVLGGKWNTVELCLEFSDERTITLTYDEGHLPRGTSFDTEAKKTISFVDGICTVRYPLKSTASNVDWEVQ